MKHELLEDALIILRQAGIEPRVIRGRHWKISWLDEGGRTRLLVVSFSPGTRNARAKSRATLRRLLAP
jgi:hypothetical protein